MPRPALRLLAGDDGDLATEVWCGPAVVLLRAAFQRRKPELRGYFNRYTRLSWNNARQSV
jgi:hypothetical protein